MKYLLNYYNRLSRKSAGKKKALRNSLSYFCLVCLAVLLSCHSKHDNTGLKNNYFDLESFFDQQIKFLYDSKATLYITATANNKSENRLNKNPDWKKELLPFINSDIHKTTFIGKYKADSSIVKTVTDTSFVITYTTDDKKLRTRKLEVFFSQDKARVKQIMITNATDNLLSSLHEELKYTMGKGYKLNSSEDTRMMGKNYYEIRAEFQFGTGYFQ